MEGAGAFFLIVIGAVVAFYFFKRMARSEATKIVDSERREDNWRELIEALSFMDDKSFDEMTDRDFENARETIGRVAKVTNSGSIAPEKLEAIHKEVEYTKVKKMVPAVRGKEPADLTDGDLQHIERTLQEKTNAELTDLYIEIVRELRKAQRIMNKNPHMFE